MAESFTVESVFTPTAFPEHTYIHRTFLDEHTAGEFDPDVLIREALATPGMIVSIVGPSKSGKTICVKNVVGKTNIVEIPGSELTKTGDFWTVALQKLGVPIEEKRGQKNTDKTGVDVGVKAEANALLAKMTTDGRVKEESEQAEETVHTVLYSALDKLVSASDGRTLLLDDFHYLPAEVQTSVAQQIKSAAERGIKICIAEVPHGTHSLIRANSDLSGRYARVDFLYWTTADLKKIAQEGFRKLQVKISDATLSAFADEAAGSPQLMQRVCLAAARYVRGLAQPVAGTITLAEHEIAAIMVKTSSLDRELVIQELIKGPPTRGTDRNRYQLVGEKTADVYETVLLALSSNPPKMRLNRDDLQQRVSSIVLGQGPIAGSLTSSLNHMKDIAERVEPNIRLIDIDEQKIVHIMDPYFFFELRWYGAHRTFREKVAKLKAAQATNGGEAN